MIHPPRYPDYVEPRAPRWRRWWLALLLLWGTQSGLLLTLWPEGRPRLELWQWSAVLPLGWLLVLSLRMLVWQVGLMNREAYRETLEAALQRWWTLRGIALPVERVLLLGPVGVEQRYYQGLMKGSAVPQPLTPTGSVGLRLRCQLSRSETQVRSMALGRQLARLVLAEVELGARMGDLRGLAWAGDAASEAAFLESLATAGVTLPDTRWRLGSLDDLDALIDAFPQACPDETDGLLCAGVVSREQAGEDEVPGEAGFLWVVGRKGALRAHRGEYLLPEKGDVASELCSQMQRYAGLADAPADCLALDAASVDAFVEGGWPARHQLAEYWGALGELAPFVSISLAAQQAAESGNACGWLSKDDAGRLAMGVVVSHGG